MNYSQNHFIISCGLFLIACTASAQQIDQSVARELGLVRSANTVPSSGIHDIDLQVGKRTELVFPEQGKLDIKTQDQGNFEILNVNNSLFIQPLKPVAKPVMGIFTLNPSNRSIVLNLRTTDQPTKDVVLIHPNNYRDQSESNAHGIPQTPTPGPMRIKGSSYDEYVRLTAFAARSAYAPDRVLNPPRGIRKTKTQIKKKWLATLIRDQRLSATPLSTWAYRGLYLSVIELYNEGSASIALTPDLVRGRFVSRAFHHNRIDGKEYTALYLVSQQPLNLVLKGY